MRPTLLAFALLGSSFVIAPAPAQAPAAPAPPKVNVSLHAAYASLRAGEATDLAIEIEVEKGWHAYHPLIVDAGAPTTIKFRAPQGVQVGPLRFPAPELGDEEGIEYLGFHGRFVVLTDVKVPPDFPAATLNLAADVSALVCKDLCIPVEKSAALALPVRSAEPQPVNAELFRKARDALPKPLDQAPYIEGTALKVAPEKVGLNDPTQITLDVRVKSRHHIQDRDPGNEDLIPSRLFVEQLDGTKLGEQKWPDAKVKEITGLGKVREQSGQFQIVAPLAIIDEKFPSGPVELRVLFTYQACTNDGTCYPPEWAEGVVRWVSATANPAAKTVLGTLTPEVIVADAQAPPAGRGAAQSAAGFAGAGAEVTAAVLLTNVLFALLGGLLLNVMPCVFPVISLKIIGFVKQAGEDRGRILRLGLAFCAGILVWFWIFAALTSAGNVPLQSAPVVIVLTAVLFVFALNLFGVFEIVLPGAAEQKLSVASSGEGYSGAFFKGLLATLLGTACTAPFFATAAAYASTQPALIGFTVFTAAGVGMALPYLLLSAFPGWLKRLPKPGPWMVTFKQAMGFVLLATVVWLLVILGDLLDARGVVWTVAFLGFLGLATWLIGKTNFSWSTGARLTTWTAATAVIVFGGWFSFAKMYDLRTALLPPSGTTATALSDTADLEQVADAVLAAVEQADWTDHVPWQPWRSGLPEVLARRGYSVYVDFTATWCITCQTNKATAVDVASTRAKMKALGVIPLKGDYTRKDPAIGLVLRQHGHNSVPLNLVYSAGEPEEVSKLPIVLTPGLVHAALDAAGSSTATAARTASDGRP